MTPLEATSPIAGGSDVTKRISHVRRVEFHRDCALAERGEGKDCFIRARNFLQQALRLDRGPVPKGRIVVACTEFEATLGNFTEFVPNPSVFPMRCQIALCGDVEGGIPFFAGRVEVDGSPEGSPVAIDHLIGLKGGDKVFFPRKGVRETMGLPVALNLNLGREPSRFVVARQPVQIVVNSRAVARDRRPRKAGSNRRQCKSLHGNPFMSNTPALSRGGCRPVNNSRLTAKGGAQ